MKKLIVCLLMIFITLPAVADTIFSDDFTDGDRGGWYTQVQSSSLTCEVIDDSAGLGSGNAMSFTNISSNTARAVVANFGAVTLAANEFISLSFDGRAGSADESDDDFRFGLFNSAGTLALADDSTNTPTDDDTGYFARGSTGTTLDVFDIVEDNGGTTILGGSAIGIQATTATTGIFLPGDMSNHAYVLKVSMNAVGDALNMALFVDGDLVLSGDDMGGSAYTTTFNEIGFASNANPDFVIDNVLVETGVVPEPATLTLLGVGILGLIRKRK